MWQETKLHFVWSMCSDTSSLTQSGRTLGPPRAIQFQMCPLASLHLPVWTRLRFLSLPCFHGKETWVNRRRGREPRHAPAGSSVQVTGATPSREGCLQPRNSPSAEVPLYWSLWGFFFLDYAVRAAHASKNMLKPGICLWKPQFLMAISQVSALLSTEKSLCDGTAQNCWSSYVILNTHKQRKMRVKLMVLESLALFQAETSCCNQKLSIMLHFFGRLVPLILMVVTEVHFWKTLLFPYVFCNICLPSALCTQSLWLLWGRL